MDEADTEQLSPDMLMAAAAGDPRIMQKIDLSHDIKKLVQAEKRHRREEIQTKDSVDSLERSFKYLDEEAGKARHAAGVLEENPEFFFKIDGITHTNRKDASEAILAKAAEQARTISEYDRGDAERHIGNYRGLDLILRRGSFVLEDPDQGIRFPTGDTLPSIEGIARKIAGHAEDAEAKAAKARTDAKKLRESLGKEFKQNGDLAKKREQLKKIEDEFVAEGKNKKVEETPPESPE
jgi:hypothetical protein